MLSLMKHITIHIQRRINVEPCDMCDWIVKARIELPDGAINYYAVRTVTHERACGYAEGYLTGK